MTILDALVANVPKIVDAGMKIMLGFLKGIADNIEAVVEAGVDVALRFMEGIRTKMSAIIDSAFKMIITFINGLADAIRNNHKEIYSACENLITAIIEAITSLLYKLKDIGKNIIKGLLDGIKSMATDLWNAASGVANDVINAVTGIFDSRSPSKVFEKIGMYVDKGLVNGLQKYAGLVSTEAKNVGSTAVTSLTKAVSKIADVVSGDIDMTPTIRPILDLTDIKSGEKTLNSLLDKKQGINVIQTNKQVSSITQDTQPATMSVQGTLADLKSIFKGVLDTLNGTNDRQIPFKFEHHGQIKVVGITSAGQLVDRGILDMLSAEIKSGSQRYTNLPGPGKALK
jgi:hypothetical protein